MQCHHAMISSGEWVHNIQGKFSLPFYLCLPSKCRFTLKEKNLLPQEHILSFKSRPYLGRV